MTFQTIPDVGRSDISAVTPATRPDLPINETSGDVRVSFYRGSDVEVTLAFEPQAARLADTAVYTDEATARSLYAALDAIFGPLAPQRAAARNSVALAGVR